MAGDENLWHRSKVLKSIMSFYDAGRACVSLGNKVSERYVVKMGLRQGCVMSPWLFNMFMDGDVREVYSRVNRMVIKMREDGERESLFETHGAILLASVSLYLNERALFRIFAIKILSKIS